MKRSSEPKIARWRTTGVFSLPSESMYLRSNFAGRQKSSWQVERVYSTPTAGLTLISNLGPQIPLTFCLTGNFNSRIESTFESAGINQTIHHIRLIISSHIVTASVDHSGEMTFDTDYELAQSVIVGESPTTYGGNRLVY